MPSVQSIGGELVVIPALEVDIKLEDDTAEERVHGNWSELLAACDMAGRRDAAGGPMQLPLVGGFGGNNGTVQLPAGTIYVSKPSITDRAILGLDERHAGITIRGAGREKTVLNDPYGHETGGEIILSLISRRISDRKDGTYTYESTTVTVLDPDLCEEDELLYFWNLAGDTRSDRQRCRITGLSGDTATFIPQLSQDWNEFRHFKGYAVDDAVAVGDTSAILDDPDLAVNFNVNDDIMISDGPGFNEAFTEWVRVTAVVEGKISFAPAVRQAYAAGLTCLLPAPHMSDITVRDLAIAAPIGNTDRIVGYVKYGVRLQFENVDLVRDGADTMGSMSLGFVNCARVLVNHVRTPGSISFGVCCDFLVNDVTAKVLYGEEFCLDFQCNNLLLDGQGFYVTGSHDAGACHRMHIDNALFLNYGVTTDVGSNSGFSVVEGSRISNVTMLFPENEDPIYINENNISLTHFSTQSEIHVRGKDIRLSNISAPTVLMGDLTDYGPSAGVLLTPLDADVVGDFTAAGRWLRSLFVRNDGAIVMPKWTTTSGTPPGLKIPSTDKDKIALSIIGTTDQSSDLTQWRNVSNSVLFGVRADGNLATAQAEETVPPGSAKWRFKIYDTGGTLIGYIPIYTS